MDGDDLRSKGEEVGLDLYSGKIEVLCEEYLNIPSTLKGSKEEFSISDTDY